MSENIYEKKYNELMANFEEMHRRNVRKTSAALKSFLIIPTIFLILVFMTNSSKTVFLVLWIVSMFAIAAVLIVTEYQDYSIRKIINQTAVPEKTVEKTAAEESVEKPVTLEDTDDSASKEFIAWSDSMASELAEWADEVSDNSTEAKVSADS